MYQIKVRTSDSESGYLYLVSRQGIVLNKTLSAKYYTKESCENIIATLEQEYEGEYKYKIEEVHGVIRATKTL